MWPYLRRVVDGPAEIVLRRHARRSRARCWRSQKCDGPTEIVLRRHARGDRGEALCHDRQCDSVRGAAPRSQRPRKRLATAVDQKNGSFGRRGRPVRTAGAFRGSNIAEATLADVGAGRGIEGAPNKPARPGGSAFTPCCCTAPCTLQAAPRLGPEHAPIFLRFTPCARTDHARQRTRRTRIDAT